MQKFQIWTKIKPLLNKSGRDWARLKWVIIFWFYKNVVPWLLDIDDEESELIKDSQFYTQPEDTLRIRGKGEHLDFAEKLLIYHHHIIDKLTPNEISRECNVSISTVNRIIACFESWFNKMSVLSLIRYKKAINYPAVQAWIKKYVEKEFGWFTSIDVRSYVEDQLSIILSLHHIRKYLKLCHNLSFKKGRSRPILLNRRKLVLWKQLFWIKLAKELHNLKILINLDESTISK